MYKKKNNLFECKSKNCSAIKNKYIQNNMLCVHIRQLLIYE